MLCTYLRFFNEVGFSFEPYNGLSERNTATVLTFSYGPKETKQLTAINVNNSFYPEKVKYSALLP